MGNLNLPIGTMGGHIWWDTLENKNGWRLQHNKVFGQYRVLDPENIRQAWSLDYTEVMHDYRKFTERY